MSVTVIIILLIALIVGVILIVKTPATPESVNEHIGLLTPDEVEERAKKRATVKLKQEEQERLKKEKEEKQQELEKQKKLQEQAGRILGIIAKELSEKGTSQGCVIDAEIFLKNKEKIKEILDFKLNEKGWELNMKFCYETMLENGIFMFEITPLKELEDCTSLSSYR